MLSALVEPGVSLYDWLWDNTLMVITPIRFTGQLWDVDVVYIDLCSSKVKHRLGRHSIGYLKTLSRDPR